MNTNFIIEKLTSRFQHGEHFTREELFDFYKRFEPDLKLGTFGWRIYDLKKKNIIESTRKGVYTISGKPHFIPEVNKKIQKINSFIKKNFIELNYNLWSTGWLKEFTVLQAANEMIILETEKDSMESVFYYLKDQPFKNIFLKPDKNLMGKYISEESEAIIIKPMISRSPVQPVKKISTATLEKILVDIFCDETIFYAYQGSEMINIYNHALKRYSINFSMLFNYARRRRRLEALKAFMQKHLSSSLQGLVK